MFYVELVLFQNNVVYFCICKAIAIEVKHDDKLDEQDGVLIQTAMLYTSCSGQRRVRILNLSLRSSGLMGELYRSCDLDTIMNFFGKQGRLKI